MLEEACTKLDLWVVLTNVGKDLLIGRKLPQFVDETRSRSASERNAMLEQLQGGMKVRIHSNENLAMKADLTLPWSKIRIIRYISIAHYIMHMWEVQVALEGKMRREASSLVVENIIAEIAPFSPAPSVKDGSEIRPSPFMYVPPLWEKIQLFFFTLELFFNRSQWVVGPQLRIASTPEKDMQVAGWSRDPQQ